MLTFETVNELTLKVTCRGGDVLFTKAGAFIAGQSRGAKNYRFEKVLLGPQQGVLGAALGALARRVTGENLPLMKVTMSGDSETFYANYGQHVIAYKLDMGEVIAVESENLLAFTQDCDYSVRFLGQGVLSQKGLATSTLTGRGASAYVAVLADGNPLVLSNVGSGNVLSVDPDAVVCWMGQEGHNCDPAIKTDLNWKNLIGQHSGESYAYEWGANQPVTVVIQPSERKGGIRVAVD
ncbi:MAG: AIM24 family protein [Clostridia bacterium]|nr:AIM24 family protein [Clostridia bacterium]